MWHPWSIDVIEVMFQAGIGDVESQGRPTTISSLSPSLLRYHRRWNDARLANHDGPALFSFLFSLSPPALLSSRQRTAWHALDSGLGKVLELEASVGWACGVLFFFFFF